MNSVDYIRGLILLCLVNTGISVLELKPQTTRKNMDACVELGKDPNFDINVIVDHKWNIYYIWNVFDYERKCMSVQFKNASSMIVDRIYTEMHEYLEQQPVWGAATMLATMLESRQEMLLFAMQGPAGYFLGVPNILKDGRLLHNNIKSNIEPLLFQLKLFDDNKYLVMMDCKLGVTTLLAREKNKMDAALFAASLPIPGEGNATCVS